jgi:hypothetical protein
MDRDGGGKRMIKIIVAVVIGILLLGLALKVLKIAIILALVIGGVMLVQNKFGTKRIK